MKKIITASCVKWNLFSVENEHRGRGRNRKPIEIPTGKPTSVNPFSHQLPFESILIVKMLYQIDRNNLNSVLPLFNCYWDPS